MNFQCAALNTGSDIHLLDHIAPLASLLEMPLITTEELNYSLGRKYYPQIKTLYEPDLEHKLGDLAASYDVLFECKYWAPHLKLLFRQLFNKEMRLVFCPHGQSDKGYESPLLAPYVQQDRVLLYGELLHQMLNELELPPPPSAAIGNYRLNFYKKHRPFYDALAETEIFSRLPRGNPILLYAPTWKDADSSTSFFDWTPQLLTQLPPRWNLIIKLHPLLEQRDPARFYSLAARAENQPNVVLLSEFPPVYPILSRVDCYLGDASSVGYDMLAFEKPLFFTPGPPRRLHSCGEIVDSPAALFQKNLANPFRKQQKELYARAFAPITDAEAKKNIVTILIGA